MINGQESEFISITVARAQGAAPHPPAGVGGNEKLWHTSVHEDRGSHFGPLIGIRGARPCRDFRQRHRGHR